MLALARTVDDAAHDRDVERLDAGIAALPLRHRFDDEALDVAGQLLERGRGGAPAARAGRHQRHEDAEAHGLQDLLRDLDLERAVAARLRRERDADGVADAFLQQHAERGRRRDDALRAHAGFGEAEMQRIVGAPGEIEIDRDQVLHRRDLGGQDDVVARQTDLFGALRGQERRLHHRLVHDAAGRFRRWRVGVLVHQMRQQLGVERAPVDADADWLAVLQRGFDDGAELPVLSSSWSREPQLAPMRTGLSCLIAVSTMAPNWRSFFSLKPTLPGLMRYLSSASAQAG